ncbi:MAG TPA: hypothetical protein VMW82_00795 [Candidatus Paceibacterota bacterium]|nr:hypothetical protein [Candidatus Paceibacterota bacterium]
MKEIIGAEAAKLAGLWVDALQKMRDGQMALSHLEWFNNLTKDDRDRFMTGGKPVSKPTSPEKFSLFVDLGIITMPDDYVHSTRLASFEKENRKRFYGWNDDITDENFSKATVQLKPGQKLHVKVFKQIVDGTTTSEERLAFLKTQNAILVSAQGVSLVFEQKREDLPKGYGYLSFDKKEALWKDADGHHGVPYLTRRSDGDWLFRLGSFETYWLAYYCLLCFCD